MRIVIIGCQSIRSAGKSRLMACKSDLWRWKVSKFRDAGYFESIERIKDECAVGCDCIFNSRIK